MPQAEFPSIAVRNYDDLVIALRTVKEFIGLSNETVEEIAGITKGHIDKLIGPKREKKIGARTLDLILGALAIQLRVEIDPDQAQRVAGRWQGRNSKQVRVRPPHALTPEQLECAKQIIFFEHTRKATLASLMARKGKGRQAHRATVTSMAVRPR
jgi:hypothetical protein